MRRKIGLLLLTLSLLLGISRQALCDNCPTIIRDKNIRHYLSDYHYRTAPLLPVDLTDFYLSPDKPQSITFKLNEKYSWGNTTNVVYEISDYFGTSIRSGGITIDSGLLELTLALPQGYYEIRFPKYDESFGICSLPAFKGGRDSFFNIGTYLTFYVRDQFRKPLVENLQRCGVYSVREICKWDDLNPKKNTWRWEGLLDVGNQVVKHHERFRALLKQYDIKLLEMCAQCPHWMQLAPNSEYPVDMLQLSESWKQWADRWSLYWDTFQIWNEPNHDGHKGYVAEFASVVKTIAWAAQQKNVKVTNGGFAFFDETYINSCISNGVLNSAPVLSLHIYDKSFNIPEILNKYKALAPNTELWVTETSEGFSRDTLFSKRPQLRSELENCLDNAKNIITCKAGGISRYYPFSLISWPTDKHQLANRKLYANGCLDYHYTPQRYMAVYAQAIRILSGKKYYGEILAANSKLESIKVFTDKKEAVLVLMATTGTNKIDYCLDQSIQKYSIEGIDGKKLDVNSRRIFHSGRIAYLIMDIEQFYKSFPDIIKNNRIQKTKPLAKKVLSPIILQPSFNNTNRFVVMKNYIKVNKALKEIKIKIKINNLSAKENQIRLECQASPSFTLLAAEQIKNITIPPHSVVEKNYVISINTKELDLINPCHITFSGIDGNGLNVLPLDYTVRLVSNDLPAYRKSVDNCTDVNLHEIDQWNAKHIYKGGNAEIFTTSDNLWCLRFSFENYKKIRTWAVPLYPFTTYAPILNQNSVILIRGKLKNPDNIIQLLMYESDGTRYETRLPINDKKCGDWQTMPVYFSDFKLTRGSFDENQNLDLKQVDKIGIGVLCPHGKEQSENELLISDFCILNQNK